MNSKGQRTLVVRNRPEGVTLTQKATRMKTARSHKSQDNAATPYRSSCARPTTAGDMICFRQEHRTEKFDDSISALKRVSCHILRLRRRQLSRKRRTVTHRLLIQKERLLVCR
jgi:hypothetical protein